MNARKLLIPALVITTLLSPALLHAQDSGNLPVPPGRIVVGDENGLYTIQADGSSKTYLIEEDEPNCWIRDGAWSADGTRLLYTRICGGESATDWRPDPNRDDVAERSAQVFIYDLASGESEELLPAEEHYQDYAGDWHPTENAALIYSDRNPNEMFNFYMVDLESRELTQLTEFDTNASRVSFDPSGRYLLYNRRIVDASSIRFEVRAFDRETNSEISVATGVTPNWSPDGKWITYATEGTASDVFIMPADCIYNGGGCSAQDTARDITFTPDVAEREPVFSPDQSQILYLRNTSTQTGIVMWDLFRQDLRTGRWQNLTDTLNISERHRAWERVDSGTRVEIADTLPVLVRVRTSQGAANLREEPSLNGSLIGQALDGQTLYVLGRNADATWYRVILPEDGTEAWLFSDLAATVEGDPTGTPIVQ